MCSNVLSPAVLYLALKSLGLVAGVIAVPIAEARPGQVSDDDQIQQVLVSTLAEIGDFWTTIFHENGLAYKGPTLSMFRNVAYTECGLRYTSGGLFYCASERKLYVDTGFFAKFSDQLGASGSFGQAFMIAHEVGHHVQNEMGILPNFKRLREQVGRESTRNLAVRVELQADCFAGMWGYYMAHKGSVPEAFLEQAENAARQLGDDAMQLKLNELGETLPDALVFGTSDQRVTWFRRGFYGGKFGDCDTFSDPY